MTRRWPCIVAATFSCLLTLATSAHAECAWVLWTLSALPDEKLEKEWYPHSGYTDLPSCLATMAQQAQVTGVPPGTRIYRKCLPDTIDPRGPKKGG